MSGHFSACGIEPKLLVVKIIFLFQDASLHLFGQIFGRKEVLVFSSSIGIFLTALEWFCYFVLFAHISHHNNNIARAVLSQSAIKQRNRTNSISMLGLFITWFLEVIYITFVGIVVTIFAQFGSFHSTFVRCLLYFGVFIFVIFFPIQILILTSKFNKPLLNIHFRIRFKILFLTRIIFTFIFNKELF